MPRTTPLLLLLLLLAALPARGETARIVAHPGAFLYESPFGRELEEIPYDTAVEVLGVERLFTRVRHGGRAGFVGNAQLLSPALLKRRVEETPPRDGERRGRVRAARPVPLHETRGGAVLRRLEPGTLVALEEEDDRFFLVRAIDVRGYAAKADLEPLLPGDREAFVVAAERPAVEEIRFRLGTEENAVHAFVAACARHFGIAPADDAFERRLRYAEPTATPHDLRDFLVRAGVAAEVTGLSAPLSGILADFRRGTLLLFRLRLDGRFRYLLLTRVEEEHLTFLEILARRGRQLSQRDFALLSADAPAHLRIPAPEPRGGDETGVNRK